MKQTVQFRRIFIIPLLIIVSVLSSGLTKNQALQQLVVHDVLNNHFKPAVVDDNYSEKAFDLYLKRLDPNKRFFTQTNIAQFGIYKYAIDDHVEKGAFDFFNAVNAMYEDTLKRITKFVPTLFETTMTFDKDEILETDPDKRNYEKDMTGLEAYWTKLITYQVLTQYINLKEADIKGDAVLTSTYNEELIKKAQDKVKKEVMDSLKRLTEETVAERRDIYIDTLINIFDTHTSYFPSEKKEDFDINISGKLEGIGAVLREEEGFIKVVSIVPGSASWRQGELKAEDLILKVAEGNNDAVDIVGVRVRDAVKLIRGKKGTEVRLTVKHVTGEIKTIPIVRDIVLIEETYAKHTIIKDSRYNKSFGYIYLPKFYRDFKNINGRNTTSDIRKALQQLSKENVDGLILDLRNNEGGALIDAVYTAGLFIKDGPIVQVKGKLPKHNILRDRDRSVVYDGPLVIMINTYSASASEILAAALQDYGRAVIVGANSFGKGTVQTFIDLDKSNPTKAAFFKPLGALKVTIQKFYRINGGSTQNKGVIPDVLLPDTYSHLEVGERFLDHALPWDTVDPLYYRPWLNHSANIGELNRKSKERINASSRYKTLIKHIDFIKQRQNETEVPLNIELAIQDRIESSNESKSFKNSIVPYEQIEFYLPQEQQLTDAQSESYKEWLKSLKKDTYLVESLSILNDVTQDLSQLVKIK